MVIAFSCILSANYSMFVNTGMACNFEHVSPPVRFCVWIVSCLENIGTQVRKWGGPIHSRYISRDLVKTSEAIMIGWRETPDPAPGQVKASLFFFLFLLHIQLLSEMLFSTVYMESI